MNLYRQIIQFVKLANINQIHQMTRFSWFWRKLKKKSMV